MKMVEKGAPRLVKQPDGTYRLEVPVDFEFDDEDEKREVEDALKAAITFRIRQLQRSN